MSTLQDCNASLENKEELFKVIVKEISSALSKFLPSRVYIAILDALGTFYYKDVPAFDEYLYFIPNFVKNNFNMLNVGDYSIPIGGVNLAFFKISEKAIIILYTKKGRSGQLLSYKAVMYNWAKKIDELIGELEPDLRSIESKQSDIEKESKQLDIEKESKSIGLQTVIKRRGSVKQLPLFVKPLKGKEKFPIEHATILNLCDGGHSIHEICEETNLHPLKVNTILRQYEKKKWIKIIRSL